MKGEKITVLQDLNGKKIQSIIKNTIHTFVREFGKVKPENKRLEVPSSQNAKYHPSKFEKEGLSYFNNRKSLNYPDFLSPFMVRVLTS